ncbi:MAG TPA: hypothetical protein VKU79_04345 [Thermoplasmataceae archaeon]|nr:hypothetical protein [Thermoplasmatales archaeon AK]HLH86075.1 hypothetical protein [Thermoplasmataceae archaeon]
MSSESAQSTSNNIFINYREQTKRAKIEEAVNYCRDLGSKWIKFIGIAGSVSYLPEPDDDVDIFLIAEEGKLWLVLLKAFAIRRIRGHSNICLSLNMDEKYALQLFSGQMSRLQQRDARNVIPISGDEFYRHLLNRDHISPGFGRFGKIITTVNSSIFVILGSYLILKGFYKNKRKFIKQHGNFSTRVSSRFFYLDSSKYRRLELEESMGAGDVS